MGIIPWEKGNTYETHGKNLFICIFLSSIVMSSQISDNNSDA